MARSALTVQEVTTLGLDPAYTSANADGNWFANNGRTLFHAMNGSGGSITITVQHPGTMDGLAVADLTVAVPAGEDRMIGPFPKRFEQGGSAAGLVYVDYSGVTSLTVAAIRL